MLPRAVDEAVRAERPHKAPIIRGGPNPINVVYTAMDLKVEQFLRSFVFGEDE